MARDIANHLGQASKISISASDRSYRNRIGGTDSEDWYRIRFKRRSHFQLTLKGLRANADIELVQDRNRNNQLEQGEVIASSRAIDRRQETIDIQGLAPGSYQIRILAKADRPTAYRLVLAAKPTTQVSFTYDVVQRTNAIRAARGLHPLALNTQLTEAAQTYAKQMAINDFFSHRGADGSTWQQRIRATGYTFSDAAENLAIDHRTPSQVIEGWMGSPGHRANMLAYQVQEIGVGYFFLAQDRGRVVSNHYWAESFGTPLDASQAADPFDRDFPSRHIEEFFDKFDR